MTVTTGAGCAWSVTNVPSWITITSGSSGTGNGTVNYSVAANTGTTSRSATLTIAGQSFTVTQGAPCGDTQPPVFPSGCPPSVNASALYQCPYATSSPVTYTTPTATDNSGTVTVSCSPASGSIFPLGATTVTCTATDPCNNTASCSFVVTVYSDCMVDDNVTTNAVRFNAATGDYIFCSGGVVIASGRGTVTPGSACDVRIHHVKGDRIVDIQVSGSSTGSISASGSASITKSGGGTVCQITDKKLTNDVCSCP